LGIDQNYVFKSISPFDNQYRSSQVFTKGGIESFALGNKLLNVTVTNGITHTIMPNQSVLIYKRLQNGKLKGFLSKKTDSQGQLNLDLPGLGTNATYVLRTQLQYGGNKVLSEDITTTGSYHFIVGNIRLKVVNGQTNDILANHKIIAYKRSSDGKDNWFKSAITNASGMVDFDLPGLGIDQNYVFKSISPFDNQYRSSQVFTKGGIESFALGNKLLNVSLLNALNWKRLTNVKVTVYSKLPNHTLKGIVTKTTDSFGRVNFDLPGLGNGAKYVLSAAPFGIKIMSNDITKPGKFEMSAGTVQVTLRNKEDQTLIPGRKLVIYEKTVSGQLRWLTSAITNTAGKVYFDPKGLGSGKKFIVRTTNLFGKNKSYFSPWISKKGLFEFLVDPDGQYGLDEESPKFVWFSPSENSTVPGRGFTLKMQIIDNQKVEHVNIRVIDPNKGVTSFHATMTNNEWVASVTKDMVSINQKITIEAEAIDRAGNKTQVNYHYQIIKDDIKPEIIINSHLDGDQVDEHGFLLTGLATDNTGFVKLKATVRDPILGVVIDNKEIEIGRNNYWALSAHQLTRGKTVRVDLSATDLVGNISNIRILLNVMTKDISANQLLNRITFGPTPELLKDLRTQGVNTFIEQQLHPDSIDDSELDLLLSKISRTITHSGLKLQYSQIARAINSKRQLLEIMTLFWENHFNTDMSKTKYSLEKFENDNFRKHALGNFGDLLKISATSPAMLTYLDNKYNHKKAPNENYARELLELHTLGVDNGYTSQDIVDVARIFTGWGMKNDTYFFKSWQHDNDSKEVLGRVFSASQGEPEGQEILDLLANHIKTAQHICTKLLRVFISDQPSTDSINNCANDFLIYADQDDQIARVLEAIFKSKEFSESLNFHNKVKTPLEFVAGIARQLPISISYSDTLKHLKKMGMNPFYYPIPTGWPEESSAWAYSSQLSKRWQYTNELLFHKKSLWQNYLQKPKQFFLDRNIETAEGVLGYLFELTLSHDYTDFEWEIGMSILTNNQSETFNIYDNNAETKIRRLIAIVLNFPAYQLQ